MNMIVGSSGFENVLDSDNSERTFLMLDTPTALCLKHTETFILLTAICYLIGRLCASPRFLQLLVQSQLEHWTPNKDSIYGSLVKIQAMWAVFRF